MKLGRSRNQGKSLGMECCCPEQEPALERGPQGWKQEWEMWHNWKAAEPSTGCSGPLVGSCLLESGLHDSRKWKGASRSGGNQGA